MAQEMIKIQRSDAYVTIRMCRPEKGNALNHQMLEDLDSAFKSIENNPAIRAMLLVGEGRHFCAGIDLAEGHRVETSHVEGAVSLESVFKRLEALPIPTVAAVQGAALAGGLELALHCDLRIAAEGARLGMPLGKVGLVPPFDFTRKLIEVIGAANTSQLVFVADPVDGRRGYEMGLVNEVVPDSQLEAAAVAIVQKIAANAPLSLRAMKASVRTSMSKAYDAEHAEVNRLIAAVLKSEDSREGARAFVEKRAPVWKGH